MKKPKTLPLGKASPFEVVHFKCRGTSRIIRITQADFNRLWKLAKEAEHFNRATRTGTDFE